MSHVDQPLRPELRTALAALVAAQGEHAAAAALRVSPGALTRALSGLAVKKSTRALVEIGVAGAPAITHEAATTSPKGTDQ